MMMVSLLKKIIQDTVSISLEYSSENQLTANRTITAGWYMLELEAEITEGQCTLVLDLANNAYKNFASLRLESGRISKRIIKIPQKMKRLTITEDSLTSTSCINSAKLIPLTGKRAKALMLKKIQACHPIMAGRDINTIEQCVSCKNKENSTQYLQEYNACFPLVLSEDIKNYWYNHIQDVWHQSDIVSPIQSF